MSSPILKTIVKFSSEHKDALTLSLSDTPLRYITALAYAIFPIIIASLYNEWVAGLIFGIVNLFQAFILNPIVGGYSDYYGSKPILLLNRIAIVLGGLLWFFFPMNNLYLILGFVSLLFLSYSFRINETYLLRITKKNEGGVIFGIAENLFSIAYFFATLSIAFFSITEHHKIAATVMIIFFFFSFFSLHSIQNDIDPLRKKTHKKITTKSLLNPIFAVKRAIHFIKLNNNYPLMTLAASCFQGIFYGTIWFVFPLHLVELGISSVEGGLQLGVYELVTIFIAGISGYLADKYNWRHIHSFGWFLILLGVALMPFFVWPLSLIIIGAIIGVGNNLFYFAAEHALEAYDIDHKEDGEFMAINKMVGDFSYGISPILVGFLYFKYGFQSSLIFSSLISGSIALWMIWLTYKIK
ncbi:MAG: MFS transporter [Nanoarchaeota archaeon]|nr:MFS transporter [Nanoarchaeota archaeon]